MLPGAWLDLEGMGLEKGEKKEGQGNTGPRVCPWGLFGVCSDGPDVGL